MDRTRQKAPRPPASRGGTPGLGRVRWLSLPAGFLLLAGWPLASQQEPTFTSDVQVVNVVATVRNKQGQIVRQLTKDDFTLEEDGRPQTIRYFAKESDLPLTLGLLVDTSGSQRRVLGQEQSASYTFLDQMLREKDMAFVLHFDRDVELLQDLTASRRQLRSALDSLQAPQMSRGGGGSPYPGSGRRGMGAGGTTLYDAVYLASDELMKRQQGRKALVVLSDGVDNASRITLARAIESAQRSDTLVYSILFSDPEAYGPGPGGGGGGYGGPRRRGGIGGWPGGGGGPGWPGGGGGGGYPGGGGRRYPQQPHPDGKRILEQISRQTGGRLFEVSKKQTVEQIYSTIQEELRNQYSLGYTPDNPDAGPGYRKITLRTRQKDLIVQAREGYYAQR